jgi:hypothetical protein
MICNWHFLRCESGECGSHSPPTESLKSGFHLKEAILACIPVDFAAHHINIVQSSR